MISIIIPCYNAEAYLEECFKSIKAQTYKKSLKLFLLMTVPVIPHGHF
ncbi:glycosyltransferase [Ligilactobacillus murinus]